MAARLEKGNAVAGKSMNKEIVLRKTLNSDACGCHQIKKMVHFSLWGEIK